MKLLVIHNKYRYLGGEDIAVENEIKFLEKNFNVKTLYFNNHEKNIISVAISLLFNKNPRSMKKIKSEIHSFNPDYVYIHNTWFMVPLTLFKFLKSKKIVTVLKLHNFRYDCTRSYLSKKHLGNDIFCNACGMEMKSRSIFNKYFKESFLKSFFIIKYGKKFFKILSYEDIKLFVLTDFHKNHLINLGFKKKNIYTFQNFIENRTELSQQNEENYIVYAGRISLEKGVEELIKSFKQANLLDFKLKIIGEGPEYMNLSNKYSSDSVKFYGLLPNSKTIDIISKSAAVVTATKLLEGQPMLLCEASSMGIPAIFPNTGGISEFFPENYQLMFEQFNYTDLIQKLKLVNDRKYVKDIGLKNKEYIEQYLSEQRLLEKIKSAINE